MYFLLRASLRTARPAGPHPRTLQAQAGVAGGASAGSGGAPGTSGSTGWSPGLWSLLVRAGRGVCGNPVITCVSSTAGRARARNKAAAAQYARFMRPVNPAAHPEMPGHRALPVSCGPCGKGPAFFCLAGEEPRADGSGTCEQRESGHGVRPCAVWARPWPTTGRLLRRGADRLPSGVEDSVVVFQVSQSAAAAGRRHGRGRGPLG